MPTWGGVSFPSLPTSNNSGYGALPWTRGDGTGSSASSNYNNPQPPQREDYGELPWTRRYEPEPYTPPAPVYEPPTYYEPPRSYQTPTQVRYEPAPVYYGPPAPVRRTWAANPADIEYEGPSYRQWNEPAEPPPPPKPLVVEAPAYTPRPESYGALPWSGAAERPYLPMITQSGPRYEPAPAFVPTPPDPAPFASFGSLARSPLVEVARNVFEGGAIPKALNLARGLATQLPAILGARDRAQQAEWDRLGGGEYMQRVLMGEPSTPETLEATRALGQVAPVLNTAVGQKATKTVLDLLEQSPATGGPMPFSWEAQEASRRGFLGALAYPLVRTYEATVEPWIGHLWSQAYSPEYMAQHSALTDRINNLTRALTEKYPQADRYGAGSAVIQRSQDPLYLELQQLRVQRNALIQENLARNPRAGSQVLSNTWQQLQGKSDAEVRAILTESQTRFREQAGFGKQFLAGFLLDPLNAVDSGFDYLRGAGKLAAAAAKVAPAPGVTVEAIKAARIAEGQALQKMSSRLLPWKPTIGALQDAAVKETVDTVNLLVNNFPAERKLEMFEKWLRNADDAEVATATKGVSTSRMAKGANATLREALGTVDDAAVTAAKKEAETAYKSALKAARESGASKEAAEEAAAAARAAVTIPEAGDVDFDALTKIIKEAEGDDIAAVADLAKRLSDAAEVFYPTPAKHLPSKARDFVNGAFSTLYLGYAPGYVIRNAANNLVTALVDGNMSFARSSSLRDFWSRFGPMPVAGKSGIGMAGSIGNSRAEVVEWLSGLREVTPVKNLAKDVTLKNPTSTLAGNVERWFSERIVSQSAMSQWEQIWDGVTLDLEKQLRAANAELPAAERLPAKTIEYIVRTWRDALNPEEVLKVIGDIDAGRADLARRVPTPVRDALIREGGPELHREIADLLDTADTPAERAAVTDVAEEAAKEGALTAAATDAIEALTGHMADDVALTWDDAILYFERQATIYQEVYKNHVESVRRVRKATDAVPHKLRQAIWDPYWRSFVDNLRKLHDALDAQDAEVLPRLGFDERAIAHAKETRAKILKRWQGYASDLRKTWNALNAEKSVANRKIIWEEFRGREDNFWRAATTAEVAAEGVTAADMNAAKARLAGGKGGGKLTPPAYTPPGPYEPALKAPPTPDELATLAPEARARYDARVAELTGMGLGPDDAARTAWAEVAAPPPTPKTADEAFDAIPSARETRPVPVSRFRQQDAFARIATYKGKPASRISPNELVRTINAALRDAGLPPMTGPLADFTNNMDEAQYRAIVDYTAADRDARREARKLAEKQAKDERAAAIKARKAADEAAEKERKANEAIQKALDRDARKKAEDEARKARNDAKKKARAAKEQEDKARAAETKAKDAAEKEREAQPAPPRSPYESPAIAREYPAAWDDAADAERGYFPPEIVGEYDLAPYETPRIVREWDEGGGSGGTPTPPMPPAPPSNLVPSYTKTAGGVEFEVQPLRRRDSPLPRRDSKLPDKPPKQYKVIGKNAAGETIYEDAKGIRSIDGQREPVQMIPRREGGYDYGPSRSNPRFDPVEEAAPAAAAPVKLQEGDRVSVNGRTGKVHVVWAPPYDKNVRIRFDEPTPGLMFEDAPADSVTFIERPTKEPSKDAPRRIQDIQKRLREIDQSYDMAYDMAMNDGGAAMRKLDAEKAELQRQLDELQGRPAPAAAPEPWQKPPESTPVEVQEVAPAPKAAPATAPAPVTAKTWTTDDKGRMVLHLSNGADYKALPKDVQADIHRYFIYSPSQKAWLSKGKATQVNNQQIAQRAGFAKAGAKEPVTQAEASEAMYRLRQLEDIAREWAKADPAGAQYDDFARALRDGDVDAGPYARGESFDAVRLVSDFEAAGWRTKEGGTGSRWFEAAIKDVKQAAPAPKPEPPSVGFPGRVHVNYVSREGTDVVGGAAAPAPATAPAGPPPIKKLGTNQQVAGFDAYVYKAQRIDGVDYEFYIGHDNKHFAIRVADADSGELVTLRTYENFYRASSAYDEAVQGAGKTTAPIDTGRTIEPEAPVTRAPEEVADEQPATPEQIIRRSAAEAARPEQAAPQPASVPGEHYGGTGQPGPGDTPTVAGSAPQDVQGAGGAVPAPASVPGAGAGRADTGDAATPSRATPRRSDGSGVAGSGVAERGTGGGGSAGTGVPRVKRLNKTRGPDFVFTQEFAESIDNGGYKTKIRQNIDAIDLLFKLENEGRKASLAEQEILAKFSGWGGAWQIFDEKYSGMPRWDYQAGKLRFSGGELSDEANRLFELIGREEYESAKRSTKNAHYTDTQTISFGWDVLRKLGFTGGRTLEPALGVGRFYGMMPTDLADASVRAGVELDTISGRIAQQLFQGVDVRVGGYETMTFRPGFFDVELSNVPFGNYAVFDQSIKDKKLKAGIHDYYFAKALEHVRHGGIIGFITSSFTMDKLDDAVRKYIGARAELVAMYRLPAGQFRKSAHTDVVTDFIFLRKLEAGETPPADPAWLRLAEVPDPNTGKPIRVNAYYTEHPEHVFGRLELEEGGQYQGEHMTVKPDGRSIQTLYRQAVEALPAGVYKHPMDSAPSAADTVAVAIAPTGVLDGQHVVDSAGKVFVNEKGELKPVAAGKVSDRIRGMAELTDVGRGVLRAMVDPESTDDVVKAAQKKLNRLYDAFVKEHGPVHSPANIKAMRGDPIFPFLLGLEDWDSATQTASKAPIFSKRVVSAAAPVQAGTPAEALSASLLRRGRIDPAYMAQATGKPAEELLNALESEGLIFLTPSGNYVERATYLSGNVRQKLTEAKEAARTDPRFEAHVKLLEAIKPPDLAPEQIVLRMGMPIVPPQALTDFVYGYDGLNLGQPVFTYLPHNGEWQITWGSYKGDDYSRYTTYGTPYMAADELLDDILNNRTTTVWDKHADGSRSINPTQTELARQKRALIEQKWTDWWRKSKRWSGPLAAVYNENFNAYVKPQYDGKHLLQPGAIPGMADVVSGAAFALRDYQADAIWRIVTSPNVLLAHAVGSGKTATMISSGMYMRQAGIIRRPLYVVPNHLLNQWAGDFGRLFPGAKVLVGDPKVFSGPAGRERLISRAAAGDWDAIVLPLTTYGLISVRPENEAKFLQEEMDLLRDFLGEQEIAGSGGMRWSSRSKSTGDKARDRSVKEAEKALAKLEARLQEVMNPKSGKKTAALTFEDLGIDYMFVDESHMFKNLQYQTNRGRDMKGLGPQAGSKRSFGMSMKIKLLQNANGGKGVTLASGTPVSNSLVEMYTIMRYLLRDDLKRLGIERFDRWADAFGNVFGSMERTQIGDYKIVNRLRDFQNYDELMALFNQVADIRTAKQINLPRPALKGGKSEGLVLQMDEHQQAIMDSLPGRGEDIKARKVPPNVDNWLKLGTDSRKASIDARFFNKDAPENPNGKLATAARRILEIYKESNSFKGTQVVFLDWGIPGGDTFDAYNDIINKLTAGGIPRNEIAYMQDAAYKKGEDRQKLFDAMNTGEIRVLLSSREKLATGANIQTRLTATHHIDTPMRWSDIEQSEGRMLRPGNLHIGFKGNPLFGEKGRPVQNIRYLTRGSFDEWSWQKLEVTARYQAAVMNGEVKGRSITIDDEITLDPAEMRAILSGDPRLKEKITGDMELSRLEVARAAHQSEQARLRSDLLFIPQKIYNQQARIDALKDAAAALPVLDKWELTVGGQVFRSTDEAPFKKVGAALAAIITAAETPELAEIGSLGPFVLRKKTQAVFEGRETVYWVEIAHPGGWMDRASINIHGDTINATGLFNHIKAVEGEYLRAQQKLDGLLAEKQQLEQVVGQPWEKQAEYDALKARTAQLEKELIGDKPAGADDVLEDDAALNAAKRREVSEEDIDDAETPEDAAGILPLAGAALPAPEAAFWGKAVMDLLNTLPVPMRDLPAFTGAYAKDAIARARSHFGALRTAAGTSDPIAALTPAQRAMIERLAREQVIPEMVRAKGMTMNLATQARDFALLDYAQRRNIDEWLAFIYPWSYWYTRTAKNWSQRLAQRPALIANYARYRNLVKKENERYYREVTGDPTAELPAYWERQIRVPFHGTDFYFDLERMLNPLNAWVEDFETRTRGQAPGGQVMQFLNNQGPTMGTLGIWVYAMWLWRNGYQEAAQEWVSYLTPFSQPLKSATALYKEKGLPGADAIPAGGWTPEQAINRATGALPQVAGGSIWERKRIGYYAYQLAKAGKISWEDFEDAAYKHEGDVWDRATQMEAVARSGPNLAGFFLGASMKPRTLTDIEIQRMWDAWGELYDARPQDKNSPEYDAWRRQFKAFDAKFPWAEGVRLARELDPLERLAGYADMVNDRLPPGQEWNAVINPIRDLWDRYRQNGYSLAGFTAEEVAKFRTAFEAAGQKYDIPSVADAARFDTARAMHGWRQFTAADNLLKSGTYLPPWGIKGLEQQYFDLPTEAEQQAFLKRWPVLAEYWDEQRRLDDEYPALKLFQREFYQTPQQAANDVLFDVLPPGGNWHDDLVLPDFVERALDPEARKNMTAAELRAVSAWLEANVPAEFRADPREYNQVRELHEQFQTEAIKRFGADILAWSAERGALTGNKTAQKQWDAANPEKRRALNGFWDFKREYGAGHPLWNKYYGFDDATGKSTYTARTTAYSSGGRSYYGGSSSSGGRSYYPSSRSYSSSSGGRYYSSSRRSYPRTSYRRSYTRRYTPRSYTRRSYSSGRSYGGGGGGYYGGGGGSGTPGTTTPTTPATPATPPTWQTLGLLDFNTQLATLKERNPRFDELLAKLWGPGVLDVLLGFLALSDADRKLWLADPKNKDLVQKLTLFMQWFEQLSKAAGGQDERILNSIPPTVGPPAGLGPFVPPVTPAVPTAVTQPLPP